MKYLVLAAALIARSGSACAGDAVKDEAEFKKCKSCHSVTAAFPTGLSL